MKNRFRFLVCLTFFIQCFFSVRAEVGPVLPGQALWCVTQRIGSNIDIINSKLNDADLGMIDQPLCSKIDIITINAIDTVNKLCNTSSNLDILLECLFTPVSGPTTIFLSGVYCLSNDVAGTISIEADDVVLDLNNYVVTGNVSVGSNQSRVKIYNGVVDNNNANGNAIAAASGSQDITLQNVTVKNAQIGINFNEVTGGLIEHCSMTQNVTGLELDRSYKIVINACTASCNTNAGFCLLSSTTNCFTDCKALSTGEGNNQLTDQTICGFVSTDGSANIFERCIANATQALSTTDSQSLVAGFALRGSESCSKIIGCESANATTSHEGVTVPFGIYLEPTVDPELTELDSSNELFSGRDQAFSPDGKFFAIADVTSDITRIYQLDYPSGQLTFRVSASDGAGQGAWGVDWYPGGQYVLSKCFPDGMIPVREFNPITNAFTQINVLDTNNTGVRTVDFTPDGRYLLTQGTLTAGNGISVYSFNPVTGALSFIDDENNGQFFNYLDIRGDGRIFAIATIFTADDTLRIYLFDGQKINVVATNSDDLNNHSAVRWSPDGRFLAQGRRSDATINIYELSRSKGQYSIDLRNSIISGGADKFFAWSADGRYLAASGQSLQIYKFDAGSYGLTLVAENATGNLEWINWSPDGSFIIGNGGYGGADGVAVYQALTFPQKNIIKDNVVYCNSGGSTPTGVGIAGSTIQNCITNNVSYSNPIVPDNSLNVPPVIQRNYAYAQNVFNPLFGQEPTLLQNISIDGCQPICAPQDIALLAQQSKSLVENLAVGVTDIENKVNDLMVLTNACAPTPVVGVTTLSIAGLYCVGVPITGNITITGDDIVLDINNRRIEGQLIIEGTASNVVVKNGVVDANGSLVDVIDVNSGAENITIQNVTVKNGLVGMNLQGVSGGVIGNCEMTSNITGVELNQSHKIILESCTAACNQNAGFCLITSTTCCVINSKALSTGQGNTNVLNQTIFGFVSDSGYGNIFERCIANATQALSTTDFNSMIAGIALRGTEGCSKIIDCEAANTQVDENGVTIPHGILIEQVMRDGELLFLASQEVENRAFSVSWSPDGNYLVAGEGRNVGMVVGAVQLIIYTFDRVHNELNEVAAINLPTGSNIRSVDWRSSDDVIAVSATTPDAIYLYQFERVNNLLTQILVAAPSPTGVVLNVQWSVDGKFLAAADSGGSLRIYAYDPVAMSLEQRVNNPMNAPEWLAWSPDAQFIAVADPGAVDLIVYEFDLVNTNTVLQRANDSSWSGEPNRVDWSPDGKYIAVTESQMAGIANNNLFVYEFNTDTSSLTQLAVQESNPPFLSQAVAWSPDSTFIAVPQNPNGYIEPTKMLVYRYDRGANQLTFQAEGATPTPDGAQEADWHPDGRIIAMADSQDTIMNVWIWDAMTGPEKNVVKDNVAYCNSGGSCPQGIGISGSSIANLIIGNTSYANPLIPTAGYDSNYLFVTNVFDERFGLEPTALQNISVGGCEPICMPADLALLAQQIKVQLCNADSLNDILDSKIDLLDVSAQTVCMPNPITTPTTINTPGIYCLANNIAGSIEVNASDVQIDLRNRKVVGDIVINSGIANVKIYDGVVDNNNANGSAVFADSGASGIVLDNLTVRNATVGINFNAVAGGAVRNCTMVSNTTGIELDVSHKVTIDSCTASCNTFAGYALMSSTTCCVINSKSIGTGDGNSNVLENEVFGFVSDSGYGNIFERCIANATQALSTTDFNSVIAGIALRGTEGCSKIIDCEAANTQVDENGVTIPHGILIEQVARETQFLFLDSQVVKDKVFSVSWSPDGNYLVAGEGRDGAVVPPTELIMYTFDRVHNELIEVAAINLPTGSSVRSVDWRSSDDVIAVSATTPDAIYLYQFERASNVLNQILVAAPSPTGVVLNVEWSNDGRYLAAADSGGSLRIYAYDPVAMSLEQRVNNPMNAPEWLAWSPDAQFIAVADPGAVDLIVYEFDLVNTNTVLQRANDSSWSGEPNRVDWSPDGKYLAVTESQMVGVANNNLFVYEFNFDTSSLTQLAVQESNPPFLSQAVAWSPDSTFIAVPQNPNGYIEPTKMLVYRYDRGANQLTFQAAGATPTPDGAQEADWHPDGRIIAMADSQNANRNVWIWDAMTGPEKNVVKDNVTYCNSGGSCPQGIGISGSSIANLIVGNTSYANPLIPIAGYDSNYLFVTNVFDERFGLEPTALQNISLGACEPICMPTDVGLILQQTLSKACALIDTNLNELTTAIDGITITINDACAPQVVSTAPTTLTGPAIYCVANDLAGLITIDGSDVQLDLNNYTVSAGIEVTAGQDRVTIFNGTVSNAGSDAIKVNSGSSDITIRDVAVKNSLIGMNFEGVSGGVVSNCSMTSNVTGIELCNSNKINMQNCIASCNTNAGYCFITSTTCCVTNSKALSTGEGNVMLDGNIFGFVSSNGYGNIFERCIANATQGLTVTGFGSVVAGFGLLGSESCTKIIECESANTQTAPNGATISYGIYLEPQLDPNLTLTAFPPIPEPNAGGSPTSLEGPSGDFSPDGKYLGVAEAAAVGGTGSKVRVYLFDRQRFILEQVADLTINLNNDAFEWCPCGLYFATGENSGTDANAVRIFKFDPTNNTIVQVSQLDINGQIEDVSWSSDGRYLSFVLGAFTSTSPDEGVYVAEFNRVTETLSLADRVLVSNYGSVDFHPNRTLLAVGSEFGGSNTIDIYQFINNSLSLVESLNLGSEAVDVAWTPDGQYLAASIGNGDLTVYFFDNSTFTLTEVAFTTFAKTYANLNWDSDGKMLAVGHHGLGAPDLLEVYNFDRGSNSLQLRGSVDVGEILNYFPRPLWTPDGGYIAMLGPGNPVLALYTAFSFPSKNVIKDNTVYCNSAGGVATSIGISGSSIANLIIGNIAYNNPTNPISVFTNYAFVTNVFNPLFGSTPSVLQNISVGGCEQICAPQDLGLLLQQIEAKVDALGCTKTVLTSSDISSGTISITTAGAYCCATDLTTDIVIDADCVSLDLNNRIITGLVSTTAGSDNATIHDGSVVASAPTAAPAAAITIATGKNCHVERVKVRCDDTTTADVAGRVGIEISGASDAQIIGCTICSGAAGDSTTTNAPNGGDAVQVTSSAARALITQCVLKSGAGGESTSGLGGDGGHGVNVVSANETKIIESTILQTGSGGAGSTVGGIGGHGVNIQMGATKTMVTKLIIRDTGISGLPESTVDVPITEGGSITIPVRSRAVNDLVSTAIDGLSSVFANNAYKIYDSARPYIFQNEQDTLGQGNPSELPPLANEKAGTVVTGWSPISNVVFQSAIEILS